MKNYVGIDLGTTNSAICSFDGELLKLYKSPEQHDVTPSAIYVDRRGRKYFGRAAYDNAAKDPDSAAILFKRVMGTSTPVKLAAAGVTMTPEQCSAEILKLLFGYLPEEMRNDPDTGTVITVPAAFDQMQKDATKSAADLAGVGKVALMQEPVAAVMSVMRQRKGDGVFLVFDLGGGTLDIAIAESISGRVNLLAHGGIAMCGGRDFDRFLVDNVVKPWLTSKFQLPDDFSINAQFKSMSRMAAWVAEKAKIALSSGDEVLISDPAFDSMNFRDLAGEEMYLDIPLTRKTFDDLISAKLNESILAAREAMDKAGISPHDIERVVFVGGPTHYKPLRDKVAFELGVAPSTDVNPMTAVAEGAAVFAESIDWESQSRGRKSSRGAVTAGGRLDLSFNFISRTPDIRAKVVAKLGGIPMHGAEFQVDSLDTGWSSGRLQLRNGATLDVELPKPGENTFKIFVFDSAGGAISFDNNRIVIMRTAATIDGIPSSTSIGVEVLTKLGGRPALVFLVKDGEPLPKKGQMKVNAGESLRAGASGAINFKLWEGEIDDPVTDNRPIGTFSISGNDFEDGVISEGAELVLDYEVLDSGNIMLEVTVPSIQGTFNSNRNFYSRQAGQIDYTNAWEQVHQDAASVQERAEAVASKVDDPQLDQVREKLDRANSLQSGETDPETTKQAMDDVLEAKKLLAKVRKHNLKEIRQLDLDTCTEFFNSMVRKHARPTEITSFDNLVKTAQRSIINTSNADFESHIDQLRNKNFEILWRQDWYVVDHFKRWAESPYMFLDKCQYTELVAFGNAAIKADDIEKLRVIVGQMWSIKIGTGSEDDLLASANIVRG